MTEIASSVDDLTASIQITIEKRIFIVQETAT